MQTAKKSVKEFFERDDNPRMTTGKKQTVTRFGKKVQKRFMSDTVKVIYEFCAEMPHLKVLYSLFARLKPFWVVQPSLSDRDTCQCRIHENVQFCHAGLSKLGIIPATMTLEAYADSTACDSK